MCDSYGLSVNVNNKNVGLAQQFELSCNNCDYKFNFMNSSVNQRDNENLYAIINARFIHVMRSIEKYKKMGACFMVSCIFQTHRQNLLNTTDCFKM